MLREQLKKVPLARTLYRSVFPAQGTGQSAANRSYHFARTDWQHETQHEAMARARILNLLNYTKTSGSSYAATQFPAGYHTIEMDGAVYDGQRKPSDRLDLVPLDFTGKSVLDIGCNQGGMIFALGDAPRWAVGLDYDSRMINACNMLRSRAPERDLGFFVFDIDRDPHGLIRDFLPEPRVDVVFLLSVCMWVTRWRELIDALTEITDTLVFEANGSEAEQDEQIAYLHTRFGTVTKLSGQSEDDPSNKRRQLFIAVAPKTAPGAQTSS